MPKLGGPEIILIIVVLVLLFGSKKIPDLARSIGRSLNEFKKGREEGARPENEETASKDTTSKHA